MTDNEQLFWVGIAAVIFIVAITAHVFINIQSEVACETLFPELTVSESNQCAEAVAMGQDWRKNDG